MNSYFSFGVYLLPYVFFKSVNAVDKPNKLEKLNLDSIHHHHQLSVIQSRDVQSDNSSAKFSSITDSPLFREDELGTVYKPDLYIEDFFFQDNPTKTYSGITKLIAGLSSPGTLFTNRSIENFYAKLAKNVKKLIPDLQVLVLRGGYRYFPRNAQPGVFATEIRRLRKAMDTLIAAFRSLGLKEVQFDALKLDFVHDKTVQRQVQTIVIQALMDNFEVRKLELNERHSILTNYLINGHVSSLKIILTPLYKEGYSRDLEADSF